MQVQATFNAFILFDPFRFVCSNSSLLFYLLNTLIFTHLYCFCFQNFHIYIQKKNKLHTPNSRNTFLINCTYLKNAFIFVGIKKIFCVYMRWLMMMSKKKERLPRKQRDVVRERLQSLSIEQVRPCLWNESQSVEICQFQLIKSQQHGVSTDWTLCIN